MPKKIAVLAKTRAKNAKIEEISEFNLIVSVKEPPQKNKANYAIIEAVARHYNVPLNKLRLVGGLKSRQKTIILE